MKSLEELRLLGLYTAMIDDLRRYYPGDAREWMRDENRLRSAVEARGISFLTIDLPTIGKHFDRCLSNDAFTPSRLPYQGSNRGEVVPRLFGALISKVFDRFTGIVRQDVDVTAVSLTRQLFYAAKKVRFQHVSSTTFKAVEEFFDIEEGCRSPSNRWDSDDLLDGSFLVGHMCDGLERSLDAGDLQLQLFDSGDEPDRTSVSSDFPGSSELLSLLQQVADLCSVEINEILTEDLMPKHGPGAVSDLKVGSKYSFPHWPEKLELRFPSGEFSLPNEGFHLGSQGDECGPRLGLHEPPSKLIAVPKTQKGPRLIASEPTAYQWAQQGVRSALLRRWKTLFVSRSISFADQSLSQRAALSASAIGTGATIDLSSASDRLSCWVVERIFRRNLSFLGLLHATRTRWLSNGIDKKSPAHCVLKKFAPMGSALTFPVQSIVYTLVAIAAHMYTEGIRAATTRNGFTSLHAECRKAASHVRVFGDDLIVSEKTAPRVIEVLSYLGLEVNHQKTFVGGNFYESCGVDAYKGVDVTPTYFLEFPVESSPMSVISAVECSNNFHKGGLWSTANWIVGLIEDRLISDLLIKPIGHGAFGLESYSGGSVEHLTKRWNTDHQEWEVLMLIPQVRIKKSKTEGTFSLLQYFTEAPEPDWRGISPPWGAGIPGRAKIKLSLRRVSLECMT